MSLQNTILLDLTDGDGINIYRLELLETGKIIITHKYTNDMNFGPFDYEGFWTGTLYELEKHLYEIKNGWIHDEYDGIFDYFNIGLKDRE